LSQVIFAVSTSETRIELAGVLFVFSKDNLTMAATDSYRLAEKSLKIETNSTETNEKKIIIPAKTLQELIRVLTSLRGEDLNEANDNLEIYISENQVLFVAGGIELISRLIEGQYPDYKQIIPVGNETAAVVNRAEFIRAVKAAAIFSKSGINDINLDFPMGKNQVIISSASSQTGETIAELEAAVKGKDNGIVINYRYLLDGLSGIAGENIKIEIINNNTPCVIKHEPEEDYIYIIMPIKQ
jgi:DNA polymerase-3 subunit beta